MGIKIREKVTGKGVHLYLDIYYKGKRRYEFLDDCYIVKGNKKEMWEKAEKAKKKLEDELFEGKYGVKLEKSNTDFFPFHLRYQRLTHFKVYKACAHKLLKYADEPEIPCKMITEDFCIGFQDHLKKELKGESPYGYFKVFKRMLKDATRLGYFIVSPAEHIVNKNPTGREIKKEILTVEEIQKLYDTHCGNSQVKKAFLFAINTGLRMCDIKALTWENINLKEKVLKFRQSKTSKMNVVDLNVNALNLIGNLPTKEKKVFTLPSGSAINSVIETWRTAAEIEKHITFHCARHTAVTHWYKHSSDLKLAGSIAGHASIRETEKYARVDTGKRKEVIHSMPEFTK